MNHKETPHHKAKNINSQAGFLFGRRYFITGNISMITEAIPQFVAVAYGMIEADLGKTLAADKDVYGLLLVGVDFAVATLPGLVVGGISEAWYWAAKKFGWRT